MTQLKPLSLADKVAKLKIDRPKSPALEGTNKCLLLITDEDVNYAPLTKKMFGPLVTWVVSQNFILLSQLEIYCAKKGITKVVCTQVTVLKKLLELRGNVRNNPKLSEYAGSLFVYNSLEILFVDPLKQLRTVPYGEFLTARYISKFAAPERWANPSVFSFEILSVSNADSLYYRFQKAALIAIDIETVRQNLAIRCISFTGVFFENGKIKSESFVIKLDSMWAVAWMRKFCNLDSPKIFQNGKYDCAYLLRFNSAPRNWIWDTAHFMHSWYSELPKDLAFLNAFFLREVVYWKDLAETSDEYEYFKYNALDSWATANVLLQMVIQAPAWAKHNYSLEFPLVYPCLLAEMTGVLRDTDKLAENRFKLEQLEEAGLRSVRTMIAEPNFNPASPKQAKSLLHALGCRDLESSNEKDVNKAKLRHPLNGRILEKILDIRGWRKLMGTYLRMDKDAGKDGEGGSKELPGTNTILYSLNPHGTDSGRLASRESAFWCGFNIQNIPRGVEVKETIMAAEGFHLAECDLEQAESRDTANITGDENLIAAVSGDRDFHSVNASAFFGVKYEEIFDQSIQKTINKALRDLAKRVNHGANYNMGPGVLIDTMGLDKIWEAKRLLRLLYVNPKDIAQHLLDVFHRTYQQIKQAYYPWVIRCVETNKLLVSRAFHHTEYNLAHYTAEEYIEQGDWTRYCFGNPAKNKLHLNSYVAHCPQSLNARTLNEAFMQVFYRIALPNPKTFRLHAQIHDSILFSYAAGHGSLANEVKDCMEIPVTVKDVSGNYRLFTVPAALKLGKKDKATGQFKLARYWSETE